MKKNNVGRPSLGITKKYSITLDEQDYYIFQAYLKEYNFTASQVLRIMIKDFIKRKKLQEKLNKEKVML